MSSLVRTDRRLEKMTESNIFLATLHTEATLISYANFMNYTMLSVNNSKHTQMVSSSSSEILIMLTLRLHVDFPTRGNNILDLVYTIHKGTYKAIPLPHLGLSDHINVMLMPDRQRVKAIKPVRKNVRVWPEGASSALQDCVEKTDWGMFKEAAIYNNQTNIEEYTETVTIYITKCIDDVSHIKTSSLRLTRSNG